MRGSLAALTTLVVLVLAAGAARAEDVTITTYYPSPRGNYQTLNSTGQTNLATGGGATDRVGIGTAAPTEKLHVVGTSAPTNVWVDSGWPGAWISVGANSSSTVDIGVGTVPLYINSDAASPTNTIVNANGGNVGIGTTTPTGKLHVVGDIRNDGAMVIDDPATVPPLAMPGAGWLNVENGIMVNNVPAFPLRVLSGHEVSPTVCEGGGILGGVYCSGGKWRGSVTFPAGTFTSPPHVLVTAEHMPVDSSSKIGIIYSDVFPFSITATGFAFYASNPIGSGGAPTSVKVVIGWIAIGQ